MSKLLSKFTTRIGRWFSSVLLWIYIALSDRTAPMRPGPVRIRVYTKGETQMKVFELDLPPVRPEDKVAKRLLTVSVDQRVPVVYELSADAVVSAQMPLDVVFDHDIVISGNLRDADAASNVSAPSEFSFVVDLTAPSQPGIVGLRIFDIEDEVTTTQEPAATTEEPTTTEEPEVTEEDPIDDSPIPEDQV